MALLSNAQRTLRLQWLLADRETPRKQSGATGDKLLARVAVEHLDAKDGEYWPFVRLPGWWFGLEECRELVASLEKLIRGESAGFGFRSQISSDVGLQIGKLEDEKYAVEVGFDLRRYLGSYAGRTSEADGEDLALFRFATTQAELVAFASALRTELGELLARSQFAAEGGSCSSPLPDREGGTEGG